MSEKLSEKDVAFKFFLLGGNYKFDGDLDTTKKLFEEVWNIERHACDVVRSVSTKIRCGGCGEEFNTIDEFNKHYK